MRYTSRAVYLQGSETPLCINRAPIHNIPGDVFTNLSMDGGMLTSTAKIVGEVFSVVEILAIHILECIPTDKHHTELQITKTRFVISYMTSCSLFQFNIY